jgi:hypothetical protein
MYPIYLGFLFGACTEVVSGPTSLCVPEQRALAVWIAIPYASKALVVLGRFAPLAHADALLAFYSRPSHSAHRRNTTGNALLHRRRKVADVVLRVSTLLTSSNFADETSRFE